MKYLFLIFVLYSFLTFANEDHGHGLSGGRGHDHNTGHNQSSEHGDDHDHAESNIGVGPEKGVVEKNEHDGFKLSPEAIKTIGFKTQKYQVGPMVFPASIIVHMKDHQFIFRLREGWLKRIEFQTLKKEQGKVWLQSSDLKSNDEIIISEVGFLRTAEIFTEEGAEHSH